MGPYCLTFADWLFVLSVIPWRLTEVAAGTRRLFFEITEEDSWGGCPRGVSLSVFEGQSALFAVRGHYE